MPFYIYKYRVHEYYVLNQSNYNMYHMHINMYEHTYFKINHVKSEPRVSR